MAFIVRSFRDDRPRLQIRMAATRDLPKLSSFCATVVIASEDGNYVVQESANYWSLNSKEDVSCIALCNVRYKGHLMA